VSLFRPFAWLGIWFLLSLVTSSNALAGPWTRDRGHFYAKISQGLYSADRFFDSSGQLQQDLRYTGHTTAVYAEVGLGHRFQFQTYIPFLFATSDFGDSGSFSRNSLGDITLGTQFTPAFLPFPHALQLDVKVPGYRLPDVAETTLAPLPGDGQVDLTVSISAGGSLPGIPVYTWAEVGYRHRTEWYLGERGDRNLRDGVIASWQLGVQLWRRHFLMWNVGAIVPFEKDIFTRGYVTIGPAVMVALSRQFAFEASFDTTVWAQNSARGLSGTVGFSWMR
jgi:hypothetical protein